ncbi:MAG: response regulator transcription factor [Thermodesulfobacteriota bacterium]
MFKTLIVEDNQTFRETFRDYLKGNFSSMIVEEASNGKEAMEKIETLIPDLVFIDIRLPNGSGLELTRKIKATHPDAIIVILTSYDLPEYRDAAARYGANHFLVKGSARLEEIIGLVKSFIARSKSSFPTS